MRTRMVRAAVFAMIAGAASLVVGALWLPPPAAAQSVTDALSDFTVDSDAPVRIESDELEVRDRERMAIFTGNVVVRQGDTTLRTPRLEVHYTAATSPEAAEQPGAGQAISRLAARGGVVVETRDQKATGDWADFDMETQEITLGGEVVLSQGQNVLRGGRLVVNLASGTSRLLSAGSAESGRVQGLFIPGAMRQKQD